MIVSRENYNSKRMTSRCIHRQSGICMRAQKRLAAAHNVRHLSSEHYLSFAVKMLADTILILFISMATALLSEGKYLFID